MDQQNFNVVVDETVRTIKDILVIKGGEYAGSEDRLANFKRGGGLVGVQPLTCLMIYLSKHYDAFCTYVKDKEQGKDRPRSESIEGRLDDMINYCILAKALIADEKK